MIEVIKVFNYTCLSYMKTYKSRNIDNSIKQHMRNQPQQSNPDSIDLYPSITQLSPTINHPHFQLRFHRSVDKSTFNKPVTTKSLPSSSVEMQFPKVSLAFNFEAVQDLLIQLYAPDADVVIGIVKTNLVLVSRYNSEGMPLPLKNHQGVQIALLKLKSDNTNEMQELRDEYTFNVNWRFQQSALCGLFDCCWGQRYTLKISKHKYEEQFLVFQSEELVQKKNEQVKFVFSSNIRDLCFGRIETAIILRLQKITTKGSQNIAETRTSLQQLMKNSQVSKLPISISGQLNRENVGLGLRINLAVNFQMITAYKFSDYIRSKMEFYLMIGIDFTASNREYNNPKSLHYIPKNGRSLYQKGTSGIVKTLMQYDNDKLVPTYGFGAVPRIHNYQFNNKVSHCFPINGREDNPNLVNTEGVMEGMKKVLPHLQFSSPTYYGEIIKKAANEAANMKRQMKGYVVLLILTDGLNLDIDITKKEIVQASYLPISIIIVAIGNYQQAAMLKSLQDKNKLMDYNMARPMRNIVQFVQFDEVQEDDIKLAEKTMAVVKEQIEEYHLMSGIEPSSYIVGVSEAINVRP